MPSIDPPILSGLPATRFRGISRSNAIVVIAATLVAIGALIWLAAGYTPPKTATSASTGDMGLYLSVVERLRHGQEYYAALHEELRTRGYATATPFNWRLPFWPWLQSLAPSQQWTDIATAGIAMVAALATIALLASTAGAVTAAVGTISLGVSLFAFATPAAAPFAEIVAGALILASAAAYGLRFPAAGFAVAVLSLFVRELAGLYVLICIYLAWREGRRWELWAWLAALVAFAAYYAWHVHMVHAHIVQGDLVDKSSWLQFGGAGFVLATAAFNGMFIGDQILKTAIVLPLCLLGLAAWRTRGSFRVGLTVAAYLCAFTIVGKHFNEYWGALYTPLMMVGLAFLPAAISDLGDSLSQGNAA